MMLTAGVPANLSMEVAADLLPLMKREQVKKLSKFVKNQQMVSALNDIGILDQFASEILKVGEASGLLNVTLEKVAQVYERLLISGIV
jgi:type II secretory pathway component PulF